MLIDVFPSGPLNFLFPPPHQTMTTTVSPTQLCQRAAFLFPVWANFALSAAANAPNRLPSHRWSICCLSSHLLSPPLPLPSYLSSLLVRPHFVAVATVAIGRCPVPSCRRHYCRIVDCRIVCAADATLLAPYSSLSSLQPHFCAHSPSPPTNCRLRVTLLVSTPLSGDVG